MRSSKILHLVIGLTFLSGSAFADKPVFRSCPALLEQVLNEDQFGRQLQKEISKSLFDDPLSGVEVTRPHNEEVLRLLNSFPLPRTRGRRVGISLREAKQFISRIESNPVTGRAKSHHYDPDQEIGFCFGRAMTAHLLALEAGVSKDSILKLFAVGNFTSGSTEWRYHVTTIIRDANDGWWTIDSFFGYPMRPAEWYAQMLKMDRGDMSLFVTEAKRFGPTDVLPYSRLELGDPHYNGYFNDLLHFFRGEAKKKMSFPSRGKLSP